MAGGVKLVLDSYGGQKHSAKHGTALAIPGATQTSLTLIIYLSIYFLISAMTFKKLFCLGLYSHVNYRVQVLYSSSNMNVKHLQIPLNIQI